MVVWLSSCIVFLAPHVTYEHSIEVTPTCKTSLKVLDLIDWTVRHYNAIYYILLTLCTRSAGLHAYTKCR